MITAGGCGPYSLRLCRHGTSSLQRQSFFVRARYSMLPTTGRLCQRYSNRQICLERDSPVANVRFWPMLTLKPHSIVRR